MTSNKHRQAPGIAKPQAPGIAKPQAPGIAKPQAHKLAKPPRERRPGLSIQVGPTTMFKSGLARFDPRDPYAFAVSLSWRDFAVLFLVAELAINTTFALLYTAVPGSIANNNPPGFVGAFFFSLETLATVGYGQMYPGSVYGHIISALEILSGVIFTAIITGLLFVRFSRPKAKIVYAANPVVTMHNGRPTFMLRIGNARSSLLSNASVNLHTLSLQVSSEGFKSRTAIEMPLIRPTLPIFAIMWTVMHVIDEHSPLHGFTPDTIVSADLRVFITVSAWDQYLGQNVSDIHAIEGGDIKFGMHYVDAIRANEDGRVFADYAAISEVAVDDYADTAARHV